MALNLDICDFIREKESRSAFALSHLVAKIDDPNVKVAALALNVRSSLPPSTANGI